MTTIERANANAIERGNGPRRAVIAAPPNLSAARARREAPNYPSNDPGVNHGRHAARRVKVIVVRRLTALLGRAILPPPRGGRHDLSRLGRHPQLDVHADAQLPDDRG